jgi:hypothetical protein
VEIKTYRPVFNGAAGEYTTRKRTPVVGVVLQIFNKIVLHNTLYALFILSL